MLCSPVFIFTSSSSAFLGRPRCGLSACLSLFAILYLIHFSEFATFFKRENGQNTKIFEFHHFCMIQKWPPTVIAIHIGVQSINTERASLTTPNIPVCPEEKQCMSCVTRRIDLNFNSLNNCCCPASAYSRTLLGWTTILHHLLTPETHFLRSLL